MTMANLAGNKAPGERKGRRQPSSYQELCSISGTTGSRHAAAINMQPDRDQPSENQTPEPITPETLGQWGTQVIGRGSRLHFLTGTSWYQLDVDDIPG